MNKNYLNQFLADNPELEELSAKLAEFNIFRVLQIEDMEIRHSNTLAWLLDPEESHGFGDIVLRRVMSNILLNLDKAPELISAASVELMNLSDIEVRREWMHVDVVVIDRVNKFVLLIENKVNSRESQGQLKRYQAMVAKEFPGFVIIPVYLTLEGDDSDDGGFIPYSHQQLLTVLERIYALRKGQLNTSVATFVEHYLIILRRLTMKDTALIELCQTIYRKHRQAIDLIVEHGKSTPFQEVAEKVLSKSGKFLVLDVGPTWAWFIPHAWAKILPGNGTSWGFENTDKKYEIMCWIVFRDNKMRLAFEVGRMKDANLRIKCVKELAKAGFKLRKAATDPDATYSRFVSVSDTVNDATDSEELEEIIKKLLGKVDGDFDRATTTLNKCFIS